ncbi:MAG: FkbM family methyltransferase [Rubellimicrobium sp.]|nr:FkbM family methyltransferase [Rubellimicrobium sp.]
MSTEDQSAWDKAIDEIKRPRTLSERIRNKVTRLLPQGLAAQASGDREQRIARVLDDVAAKRPRLRFIQIGGCDGKAGDPIRTHVTARSWRGVVVEPVPENFARLQQTYAGHPDVACVQAAIGATDGTRAFHFIDYSLGADLPEPLPEWAREIGSFDRAHLEKHAALFEGLDRCIATPEVDCLSLPTLMQRAGMSSVDLLHIDAEGADVEILRSIDFAAFTPEIVMFEHFHMSNDELAEMRAMFGACGYEIILGSMNAIARRPPLAAFDFVEPALHR